MSEAENKTTSTEENDNEPIYYNPSRLSLVATASSWFSWFTLAVFVLNTIIQGIWIRSQIAGQGLVFSEMAVDPNFQSYLFSNLLLPFFTGIVFFLVLQGVSIGLNVVLEMDFNLREKMEAK
jgi:hypothetical protein